MQRRLLIGSAAAAAAAAAFPLARAATPARMVVGFAAGSNGDLVARAVAPALEEPLQRPVIVENKPGAGGRFAPQALQNARPGEAVFAMLPGGALSLFPFVFRKLGYDPQTLAPVTQLLEIDMGLIASPRLPQQTMAELVAHLRTPAGRQASYGSSGIGSILHFLGVGLSRSLGADLNHVPYSNTPLMYADIASGTLPLAFTTVSSVDRLAQDGKLRVMGVVSPQRYQRMPQVPTFRESGIDMAVTNWYAIYGMPGLPKQQAQEVAKAIEVHVQKGRPREQLQSVGTLVLGGPERLAALQVQDTRLWGELVRASGFQAVD